MPKQSLLGLLLLTAACADLTAPGTDETRSAVPSQNAPAAAPAARVAAAPPTPAPPGAPAAPRPGLDRVTASHVLIAYQGALRAQPNVTRSKEEARKMAEAIRQRALNHEDFAALARAHSDDPSAKRTGGNLGTFDRNTMAKAFSDAAFALEPDQVSAVVETPFGFHVIKREK